MSRHGTTYEIFRGTSAQNRRLLRQEELILEVTEALAGAMIRQGITKSELARRLGKSKGFVSQVLAGNRNLTLRTIADIGDALACQVRVHVLSQSDAKALDVGESLTTSAGPISFAPRSSFVLVSSRLGESRQGVGASPAVAA